MARQAPAGSTILTWWGWAFVTVALVAAVLGLLGVAELPASAAWGLLASCVVFVAAFFGAGSDAG